MAVPVAELLEQAREGRVLFQLMRRPSRLPTPDSSSQVGDECGQRPSQNYSDRFMMSGVRTHTVISHPGGRDKRIVSLKPTWVVYLDPVS